MAISRYSLKMPGSIFAGENALEELSKLAAGYDRIALFTDKSLRKLGLIDGPMQQLTALGAKVEIFDDIPAEPPVDDASRIVEQFAGSGCDLIVAIGGGSVMDVAKLASVANPKECSLRDLLADPSKARKYVKTIMIPTTAGTGSEATQNAIVLVPEQDLKVGIVNEVMIADNVILDAEMTRTLPQSIAAATGVDALAHCIECFTAKKANPLSDIYALSGLKMIFENIEKAANEGDMEARRSMLLASFFGGVSIVGSSTTGVHALSYPLGGKFHIAHGVANAILLLPVMKFNESASRDRFELIYDYLNPDKPLGSQEEKSAWVIKRLGELITNLRIPSSLQSFGVSKDNLDELVAASMKVTRLLVNNPREITPQDARDMYLQVM